MRRRRRPPNLIWPLGLLWRLACLVVRLVGRLTALILGAALIIVGLLLSATLIGAVVGIPLILIGAVLLVCALTRRRRPRRPRYGGFRL